ncbi:competence/damage-inducible protein A [Alkalihalobacterium elongatum]|uniref:competence/damage-inducible protein A n=1 Tax=Alkalihalobacterium elongatum TaxID=2675466 RepID=UPI001C1F3F65|nr:competence/damage-inducible protein A [Alkalihalobacterium elongatum]
MNSEIIAVGSELLLGQIANTNGQFLSQQLAPLGINVYYHTVVGDNKLRLQEAVIQAKKRANLIIITGGLGPTKDDLTKEAVAELLDRKLVYDEPSLKQIELYFQNSKRPMTENNKKQALVIEGSSVLNNDHGMAPGMAIFEEGTHFMLLPGPPKELKPMFTAYGENYLLDNLNEKSIIESRVLRFFGIGEAKLEEVLIDLIEAQSNPTIAPLAADGEVTLRLTVKHDDKKQAIFLLDELEAKINARVGKYLYGYDDTSLMQELVKRLLSKNYKIASAESLTGGMFSQQLTDYSGISEAFSSGIVTYSTEMKEKLLSVSKNTLAEYGAVSNECAIEMALGVKRICEADIGISFTGVAGPNHHEGKDVGTVYIGVALPNGRSKSFELNLSGTRGQIRERSVKYGCYYLLKEL